MITAQTNESLDLAARIIDRGGIIAFRTDTFYGLGADPFNREAVEKIKSLKGREENKPILIVISGEQQLERFVLNNSAAFERLAKAFWPGPVTLIGGARDALPEGITAGSKTVGVRLPNDDRVRALVRACGGGLTATSANLSHLAPSASAKAVQEYFGEQVDLIVDDGDAQTDLPSTVVDASGDEAKLIREGAISWDEISQALT